MIELIIFFGQFVAVVGNAGRTIVLTCLSHSCFETVEFLYEADFFFAQRNLIAQCGQCTQIHSCFLCLAQNRRNAGIRVLDKRPGVTIEVNTLGWVEQHILAGIDFQDEVLQCTQSHFPCNLSCFCFWNILIFAHFFRHLIGIFNHLGNQVVGIHHCSLTTFHLAAWQFHHSV